MKKRLTALSLAAIMIAASFAGCSPSTSKDEPKPSSTATSSAPTESKEDAPIEFSYPIDTDKNLKIWSNANKLQKEYINQKDSPFHKGLNERTGVELTWEWPTGDAMQAFNLMIASDDLPDIIYINGINPQQYIDDGYMLALNDPIDKWAPNYKEYIEKNDFTKQILNDEGNHVGFTMLRGDDSQTTYAGLLVRQDWLDEQKLAMPVTIDDWTNMLTVFNKAYGAKFTAFDGPWGRLKQQLWGSYGIMRGYFVNDGKVKFGMAEPAYKDFLTQMNSWYKAGLIDPDIATLDDAGVKTKVLNNKTGAVASSKGMLSQWNAAIAETDSTAKWVAAPYPVLKAGDPIEIIHMDSKVTNFNAMITSSCKEIELATRVLDYGYSEEGMLYWNFGIEGESYKMENGKPVFTENVTNYPDGISSALDKYTGMQWMGMSVQMGELTDALATPAVIDAIKVWTAPNNMINHMLPTLTASSEESAELSTLQNAIDTYTDEMYFKFIFGDESLDNFDKYTENLSKLKMDRILEIKQAQYDRYLAR